MRQSRETADLVVLIITAVVSVVIVLMTIALIILEVIHPEEDQKAMANVITDLVTVMLGALIGFIGGRATVKRLNGDSEVDVGD